MNVVELATGVLVATGVQTARSEAASRMMGIPLVPRTVTLVTVPPEVMDTIWGFSAALIRRGAEVVRVPALSVATAVNEYNPAERLTYTS